MYNSSLHVKHSIFYACGKLHLEAKGFVVLSMCVYVFRVIFTRFFIYFDPQDSNTEFVFRENPLLY